MRAYLDDVRTPPADESWTTFRNPVVLMRMIQTGNFFDEISFDHDLGCYDGNGREVTGYDVMLEVEKRCYFDPHYVPPYISIHSANAGARQRMELCREKIMQFRKERI